MTFEKPSPGNPHQLTIKQHIFPQASIERFCTTSGAVSVQRKSENASKALMPNNPMFCAKRVWDQRAESGYMIKIENTFQDLASKVVCESITTLTAEQQAIVTDMFALWNERFHTNKTPTPNHQFSGVLTAVDYSKREREELEKIHISSIGPDATFPGRHIDGIRIQMKISEFRRRFGSGKWGIIKSLKGEFIVPDTFGTWLALPLSPSLCFCMGQPDCEIDEGEVAKINDVAIQSSEQYYFARDFAFCPRS